MTLQAAVTIRAHDRASHVFRSVGRSMSGLMAQARGLAAIALPIASFAGLQSAIRQTISVSKQFETTLLDIAQKADLNDQRMAQLGRRIRDLAPRINSDAQSVAKSMDFLLGAGLDPKTAEAVLDPIGRTAQAYMADITDVSKATYAMIDSLRLPAERVQRALDMLAQAGKEGNFELSDMAQHFPAITAQARALEMTGESAISRIGAALQIVRKGAGDSSSAATNLQNLMQKIASPEVTKAFKKLGIDIRAELKKVQRSGGDIFEMIVALTQKALKGDLAKLGDIFGDAQVQAAMRPLIQNIEEYRRIREATRRADGVVQTDFERRVKTFEARWARLKASLQELGLRVGEHLMPFATKVVDGITSIIDRIANSPGLQKAGEIFKRITDSLGSFEATVITAGAAVLGMAAGFIALRAAAAWLLGGAGFAAAAGGAGALAANAGTAAATVGRLARVVRLFTPTGLLIAGVTAVAAALTTVGANASSSSPLVQELTDNIAKLRAEEQRLIQQQIDRRAGAPPRDPSPSAPDSTAAREKTIREQHSSTAGQLRDEEWQAGFKLKRLFEMMMQDRQMSGAMIDLQRTRSPQDRETAARVRGLMETGAAATAAGDWHKAREAAMELAVIMQRIQNDENRSNGLRNVAKMIAEGFSSAASEVNVAREAIRQAQEQLRRNDSETGTKLIDLLRPPEYPTQLYGLDPVGPNAPSHLLRRTPEQIKRAHEEQAAANRRALAQSRSTIARLTPEQQRQQQQNQRNLQRAGAGASTGQHEGAQPFDAGSWRQSDNQNQTTEVTTAHTMSGSINVMVRHDAAFLRAEVQRQISHAIQDNRGGTGQQTYGGSSVGGGGGVGVQ